LTPRNRRQAIDDEPISTHQTLVTHNGAVQPQEPADEGAGAPSAAWRGYASAS
jgi:hypothetical protein